MTDSPACQRLECEARTWLRKGYTTPEKIKELRELLRKRKPKAVEAVIEEMRRQWVRRREWMGEEPTG